MREFKNPKARELFLASLEIEKQADERAKQEVEEIGYTLGEHGSGEMFTEAAGLRVLADEIEDGLIDEEEISI